MTDFLLPPSIYPATEDVEIIDSNSFPFQPQFGAGPDQVQQYASPRLRVRQRFVALRQEERAIMLALVAKLQGRYHRLRAQVGYSNRGSWSASELLTNGTFASGTTGWTSSNAELVLSAADRVLRGTRTGVTGDRTIQATVATTVSGVTYAARLLAEAGRGAMDYQLQLGTSAGGTQLSSTGSDFTAGGLRTLVGTATGTSTYFSILDGTSSRSTGGFQEFTYASLRRVALVQGASQTGNGLLIDQLPTSTDGLLLRGDLFEINGELKRVTAALNSDGSGIGYLQFDPPLVRSPADNDPVHMALPLSRFVVSEAKWTNRFGVYADLDLTLDQVYE